MANFNASTIYRGIDKASPVMDKMARNALANSQKIEGAFGRMAGRAGKALGKGALNVAKYGVMAASGVATYATKQAIGNYLEFESEMLNVKAITRSNTADYDKMTQSALNMAKKSVFTSSEVAQGMKYLGMAGWETKNIIAGMPGILQLAAATQSDLAQTSDMLSDSMTAFRIPAEQAIHVADVFAGTATRTNTNMEQLQEAMKDAAPAAVNFGVDIETTAAMLGVMADSGIKGTRAGTAFKNMTMRLANPTKNAAGWLKKMNVEVADQDGNFRNILDITEDLKTGLAGLTQEEQSVAKGALFGKLAIAGVSAVLGDQEGKVTRLSKAFRENIGVAAEMAEVQLSGASGAVKRMTSAWDAFSIAAVQKYSPALQGLAEHLTALISGELGETGKTIQKGNITNLEEGIKGDVIQSPFPTISDKRFQRGYERYRLEEKKRSGIPISRTEQIQMERLDLAPVNDPESRSLFEEMYKAEKRGSGKRAAELGEKNQEIRNLYNLDAQLKQSAPSPLVQLMEKVTKNENIIILKAPKGMIEAPEKLPPNIKLVETM
jgi:TP901 family phage tail tape measure protein